MAGSCGVYTITNRIDGRFYLGASKNTRRRWWRHRADLRGGIHHAPELQRAWVTCGEKQFVFAVIEEVEDPSALKVREQFYLDSTRCYEPAVGYNIARDAAAPMRGRKQSAETIEKRALKARGRKQSAETIEKRRALRHSDETKAKMCASWQLRKLTPVSDEARAKMRVARLRHIALTRASKAEVQ